MSRLRRALRPALITTATLFALLPAASGSEAQAAQLPPQGMYETCNPGTSPGGCAARLQRIAQAGFRVVINGSMLWGTTPQQLLAYVDAAQADGVQVIWPLHAIDFAGSSPDGTNLVSGYSNLAVPCGCKTNQDLLAYVISLARSRSNTWGYYLADEPTPDAHAQLSSLVDRVKALDPSHPRLIMTCGCAPNDPRSSAPSFSDLDVAVGADAYPVYDQAPSTAAAYNGVASIAQRLQGAAAPAGRPTVMALQSWRWGDSYYDSQGQNFDPARTRFPTQQEIQAQRDAAIANAHPGLILWFTLYDVIGWNGNERPWYWADPSDPQRRWSSLVGGAFATPAGSPSLPTAVPAGAGDGPARKPVAHFTLHASRSPARIGSRVVLDARRSYDPAGNRLRYRWTLNGHRIAGCSSQACSFRPRRSGTQRVALVVSNGAQTGTASRHVHVRRHRRRG